MSTPVQNRIFKDERYWELISGPWTVAEKWLMDKQIKEFKSSGIDCTTEPFGDHIYVYRCAKGYVYLKSKLYDYAADFKYKHKHTEFRKIQKEIQRDLCAKLS